MTNQPLNHSTQTTEDVSTEFVTVLSKVLVEFSGHEKDPVMSKYD